jgi:hypothetical protein
MLRALQFPVVAAILLASFASPGFAEETGKAPGRAKGQRAAKAGAAAKAEEAVKSALPPELTDRMPIGREFKGVAIPSYTGDKLKSVMTSDTVVRVDERHLDLFNLVVKVYNGEGEADTTISMDEAAYDLVAGELTSKTPSTIKQPRFTMTGDKMIFLTDSRVARMVGNVRLLVPDAGKLAPDFGLPGANPAAEKPKTP